MPSSAATVRDHGCKGSDDPVSATFRDIPSLGLALSDVQRREELQFGYRVGLMHVARDCCNIIGTLRLEVAPSVKLYRTSQPSTWLCDANNDRRQPCLSRHR